MRVAYRLALIQWWVALAWRHGSWSGRVRMASIAAWRPSRGAGPGALALAMRGRGE
jgi:hypothetical protein